MDCYFALPQVFSLIPSPPPKKTKLAMSAYILCTKAKVCIAAYFCHQTQVAFPLFQLEGGFC